MSIGADYPDYQSYANWRGPDIDANAAWPLSASDPFSASGYVTNYASLIIFVSEGPADGCTVTVSYWTDDTQAIPVGNFTWTLPPGYSLYSVIPALGNFVTVTVETVNAASTNVVIAISPTSTAACAPAYPQDQNYIAGFDTSIPAGTTNTYVLPYVSSGRCSVHFQDLAASGKVSVFLWTANGLAARQQRLYNSNNATGPVDISLNVPAVPLILQVDNTDTVAHSVDYYCCVDGRL